ncbi:MAG: NAD-dependent epimerase/dehydratase family protein [Jatrophihabitans sp.]
MRIAVTGARGLLGRAVTARAVEAGNEVISLDQTLPEREGAGGPVREQTVDVTDRDALRDLVKDADALIHLAAYVTPLNAPDHVVHNTNVVANYNVLSVAVELGIERVCLASSINAIGGAYSRHPRYDYFPVDERHPTYAEDPYSVSKWEGEQQASAVARRYPALRVASLRMHAIRDRAISSEAPERNSRDLWGYSPLPAVAAACLATLTASFGGHEVFYIVAAETVCDLDSLTLREQFYPEVPVVGDLSGRRSFFDCAKARSVLKWQA